MLTFETLFYIFYNYPHDVNQFMARKELELRGWEFTKDPNEWQHQKEGLRFDLSKWKSTASDH